MNKFIQALVAEPPDEALGGFRAEELAVSAEIDTETYNACAALKTTGIIGFLHDLAFEAEASSRTDTDGLSPEVYVSNSRD